MLEEFSTGTSQQPKSVFFCCVETNVSLAQEVFVTLKILSMKSYFQIVPKLRMSSASKQAGNSVNTSIVRGNEEVLCEYVTPVRPTAGESILARERKAAHIIYRKPPSFLIFHPHLHRYMCSPGS